MTCFCHLLKTNKMIIWWWYYIWYYYLLFVKQKCWAHLHPSWAALSCPVRPDSRLHILAAGKVGSWFGGKFPTTFLSIFSWFLDFELGFRVFLAGCKYVGTTELLKCPELILCRLGFAVDQQQNLLFCLIFFGRETYPRQGRKGFSVGLRANMPENDTQPFMLQEPTLISSPCRMMVYLMRVADDGSIERMKNATNTLTCCYVLVLQPEATSYANPNLQG